MQATRFEFEQRFWVIGAIFFVGFSLSWLDHTNAAVGLVRFVVPSLDPDSDRFAVLVRSIFFAAAALVFLAAALRTWSTAYLRVEVVHDAAQHSGRLEVNGPYRRTRNPLYFAVLLLAAGVATMASRLGWAFIVLGMWVFMERLIRREEAGLLASQGDSYRAYLNAVPRLFPSLTPRVPAADTRPRWGQAFIGELFFWLFGAGMLVFACTLNGTATLIVMAASMAVYFAAVAAMRARTRRAAPGQ